MKAMDKMQRIHKKKKKRMIIYSLLCLILLMIQCILGCPIYRFLHIHCLGCGLTRAWLHFFSGDWHSAFQYHPFFWFAPLFIFLFAWRDSFPQKVRTLTDLSLFIFAFLTAGYRLICFIGT